jgi:hypothetical protein
MKTKDAVSLLTKVAKSNNIKGDHSAKDAIRSFFWTGSEMIATNFNQLVRVGGQSVSYFSELGAGFYCPDMIGAFVKNKNLEPKKLNGIGEDNSGIFTVERGYISQSNAVQNLSEILTNCLEYASEDENRYVINGVYIGEDIVATDGRTLIVCKTNAGLAYPIILPSFTVKLLDSMAIEKIGLSENIGENSSLNPKFATFHCGDVTIETKLVDGNYPNYKAVIPESQNKDFIINIDLSELKSLPKPQKEARWAVGQNGIYESGKNSIKGRAFPKSKTRIDGEGDLIISIMRKGIPTIHYVSFDSGFIKRVGKLTNKLYCEKDTSVGFYDDSEKTIIVMGLLGEAKDQGE